MTSNELDFVRKNSPQSFTMTYVSNIFSYKGKHHGGVNIEFFRENQGDTVFSPASG